MITSLALMDIYKAPAIPLAEICERYFALSYDEALKRASRCELPVPTFRLTSSRKSPVMVSCEALGDHIDKFVAKATQEWERCQV
jgi:hypothetical protein